MRMANITPDPEQISLGASCSCQFKVRVCWLFFNFKDTLRLAAGHKSLATHYLYGNLQEHHIRDAFNMFARYSQEKEGSSPKSVTA